MLITKGRSEVAAPWWSRMKMKGGPAYLCANETDAGERANWEHRRKEKNFWSEILEKARGGYNWPQLDWSQLGAQTFMSANRKEKHICGDKNMVGRWVL